MNDDITSVSFYKGASGEETLASRGENMTMRCVIVESPYAGDIDTHVAYAKRCLKDCLNRGEAPIASHLLYTQMLDDFIPEERELGIQAGFAWIDVADAMIFYIDYGVSKGMANALSYAMTKNKNIERREIGKNPEIDHWMDRDRDADLSIDKL